MINGLDELDWWDCTDEGIFNDATDEFIMTDFILLFSSNLFFTSFIKLWGDCFCFGVVLVGVVAIDGSFDFNADIGFEEYTTWTVACFIGFNPLIGIVEKIDDGSVVQFVINIGFDMNSFADSLRLTVELGLSVCIDRWCKFAKTLLYFVFSNVCISPCFSSLVFITSFCEEIEVGVDNGDWCDEWHNIDGICVVTDDVI